MVDPDDTPVDERGDHSNDGDAAASLVARGGRPTRLTVERVADFLDAHEAEHGIPPTVRQLQDALGGGRTKLVALRDQVRAGRLLATAASATAASGGTGTPASAIERAAVAALEVLALEAARGAEHAIEAARAEADRRAESATRVRERAERVGTEAALVRERAVGRAEALDAELAALRDERRTVTRDLDAALERQSTLEDTAAELRAALADRRAAVERAETAAADLGRRLDETAAALDRERRERADDTERLTDERDAARRRTTDLEAELVQVQSARDAALARAGETTLRLGRAEGERDDARGRAEALVAELATSREAAAAARQETTSVQRDHDRLWTAALEQQERIGRLEAELDAARREIPVRRGKTGDGTDAVPSGSA